MNTIGRRIGRIAGWIASGGAFALGVGVGLWLFALAFQSPAGGRVVRFIYEAF